MGRLKSNGCGSCDVSTTEEREDSEMLGNSVCIAGYDSLKRFGCNCDNPVRWTSSFSAASVLDKFDVLVVSETGVSKLLDNDDC